MGGQAVKEQDRNLRETNLPTNPKAPPCKCKPTVVVSQPSLSPVWPVANRTLLHKGACVPSTGKPVLPQCQFMGSCRYPAHKSSEPQCCFETICNSALVDFISIKNKHIKNKFKKP